MSDFTVSHEESGSKGRYFITHASGTSELTYSVTSPTLVIADHTSVASGFENQGVGLVLLEYLLNDARTKGSR